MSLEKGTRMRVAVRPYRSDDRAAVLAIFDGNAAHYFGEGDRGWLAETLDEPDGPAFVVTVGAQVAAFGGYEIWDHYNKALLYWGMADRRYHGAGLGRLLLLARLLHVAEHAEPPTRYVTVDTSPMVAPFFLACGFERTAIWPQGYRSGMEMHELRFDLAATDVDRLRAALDDAHARAEAALGGNSRAS
jgi:GNAT superfamily N-acetyltransferase